MKMRWKYQDVPEEMDFVDNGTLEIERVFNGVTFVSAEGEKLSVVMRDNGFEAHYYQYGEGEDDVIFETGWIGFNRGAVRIPNDIVSEKIAEQVQEIRSVPTAEAMMRVWITATQIVDAIVEKHPLSDYKTMYNAFVIGTTVTAAEQRLSLIREVADWLLGKEE